MAFSSAGRYIRVASAVDGFDLLPIDEGHTLRSSTKFPRVSDLTIQLDDSLRSNDVLRDEKMLFFLTEVMNDI